MDRATSRLRLSADHTVVAIAGATGSGKSSTFNALTGLELSAVGVRRPTTSGPRRASGASRARRSSRVARDPGPTRVARESMLDAGREDNALRGVVSVGGRMHSLDDMTRFVEVFLTTSFSGDERHARRIGQMASYEQTRELPPLPDVGQSGRA